MLTLNTQPAEKAIHREDGSLDVVNIWSTIQGEGPFAGTPAVFVRLGGCNLTCPRCDTDYTTSRKLHSVGELMDKVQESMGNSSLIVLTGGEPFRQNIGRFCNALLNRDFRVQIETNGTLYQPEVPYSHLSIVCSPKTPKLSSELAPHITAYKYILEAGKVSEEDGLPLSSLGMPTPPARPHNGCFGEVFVQPLDEQDEERNKLHRHAAVESCMKFGYRLSLQIHKYLNLE